MRHRRLATLLLGLLSVGGILQAEDQRTLVVVLDAVPFATMERLTSDSQEDPLFEDFERPLPLISTFPSSTSIALAGILAGLGLERSPGYEARFFDWGERRRRGGGLLSYYRITFPWRQFFDWNRTGPVRNALHAARPIKAGIREIGEAVAAFRASPAELFTIYIADTDTVAHLFGPAALDPILRTLEHELRDLEGIRIVLLSDHGLAGGEPLKNVLPAVKERVSENGWRWRERLEGPEDVVLTPYGLVSSFEAYAAPELTPVLAASLGGVSGVDFCIAASANGWRVTGSDLSLDFERRSAGAGDEWRWRAAGSHLGLVAALPGVQEGDWVEDEALLRATALSDYPDPLYRLVGAFTAVENPASILCSLAPGYMFGARGTERSARWTKGALRWTHGALSSEATLGFLMSNRPFAAQPSMPQAIRFDRALDLALNTEAPRATSE